MVNVASARMSYLYAQDRHDEIKSAISKSMDYIFFMGYGAVFGLLGISHNLVPIFFGPGGKTHMADAASHPDSEYHQLS